MKKDKSLDQLSMSTPQQLNLFELLLDGDSHFSNTVELYDTMPKYSFSEKREFKNIDYAMSEHSFKIRNKSYTVVIRAAIISKGKGKDKSNVLIFPGNREELVEDALRKLACNGNGCYMDGQAGVLFTLYELQQELKRMNHGFDINDIKESIQVLRNASIECTSQNERVLSSNFFSMSGLQSRDDWVNKAARAKCYVQFNPLITKSINEQTFRQLNYDKCMLYKNVLARYIHKRISHHWIQTSHKDDYTILMTTILLDSGRTLSDRMSTNRRAVETALNNLVKNEVIIDPIVEVQKEGRKIKNVKYILFPHDNFISEMIKANWRHNIIKTQALLVDK